MWCYMISEQLKKDLDQFELDAKKFDEIKKVVINENIHSEVCVFVELIKKDDFIVDMFWDWADKINKRYEDEYKFEFCISNPEG
jgi:hypothetical protein